MNSTKELITSAAAIYLWLAQPECSPTINIAFNEILAYANIAFNKISPMRLTNR